MEYTFAPVITTDKLDYLQMLIQDFLIEFTQLYPDRPLTPKMHYLAHAIMDEKVSVTTTLSRSICHVLKVWTLKVKLHAL